MIIEKSKNLPSGLSSFKSKADKLDVGKLVPVPNDLSKLSDAVKILLKKTYIMLRLPMLKILYLILLT